MTPTVPPVIAWLTVEPEIEADPEMIAEGVASTPVYTVAVTAAVKTVSLGARSPMKSKGIVTSSPTFFGIHILRPPAIRVSYFA
jgi:hypothetical protein